MILLSLKNIPDVPFCGEGKRACYRTRPGGLLQAGKSGQRDRTVRGTIQSRRCPSLCRRLGEYV